jgi:type IV secretion system protein VirB10
MTNADTNGNGAVASVHLVLQGKGGVGTSFVSSILAQYFRTKSAPVHCLDTDPVNATFAQYRRLEAEHLKVLKRGIVNEKEFDVFVQRACKGQGVFIVDTGATTFVPLWNYILENQILEQSLNSDLPGELKALVTSNVCDTATGLFLLIPQGSRLIGKYDSRIAFGEDGVQVAWSRIIFPNATSLDLDGMLGLGSHGNSGLRDQVDHHCRRLMGFKVLTSLFTAAFDISQRTNQTTLTYPTPAQTAGRAVGQEPSETGAQITRRNLNVQPTIKVPAGYKFTVPVNRDVLFETPYQPIQPDEKVSTSARAK